MVPPRGSPEVNMFGRLGPMELLLIFLIVVLLFGGKKLPEIAKGLGKGIREFKSSVAGEDEAKEDAKNLAKPDAKSAQDNPKS
jgi:sec-independent protein translocase protein TatA